MHKKQPTLLKVNMSKNRLCSSATRSKWFCTKSWCPRGVPRILMPCCRVGTSEPLHTKFLLRDHVLAAAITPEGRQQPLPMCDSLWRLALEHIETDLSPNLSENACLCTLHNDLPAPKHSHPRSTMVDKQSNGWTFKVPTSNLEYVNANIPISQF